MCSQLLYPFTKEYVLMLAVLVIVAIFGLFAVYLWMLQAVHQKYVGNLIANCSKMKHAKLCVLTDMTKSVVLLSCICLNLSQNRITNHGRKIVRLSMTSCSS